MCTGLKWHTRTSRRCPAFAIYSNICLECWQHLGPAPCVAPQSAALRGKKLSEDVFRPRTAHHSARILASSFLSLFGFSSEAEQSLDSESKTYCARSKIPERKNRSACFAICSHRREDKTEGVEVGVEGGSGVENEGYNWNGPPRREQIILGSQEARRKMGGLRCKTGRPEIKFQCRGRKTQMPRKEKVTCWRHNHLIILT